ncbi:MAG: AAA family ATPase [Gammaproteobacteria bacterium]|nr:AAA family ATPase [Gammaproteobacteria bacterium]
MKQLWVLVGGNGAGKSTFYRLMLKSRGIPFINANQIAREIYPDNPEGNSYNAAKIAEKMCREQIQAGNSFCFETVFSHPSKVDFLGQAKALGYQIILVLIHLEHTDLNKARISQRVSEGGHNVPDEKVEQRIPRTLAHVKKAIPLCDQVRILDNSRSDNPYTPLVSIIEGQMTHHFHPLPGWTRNLDDEEIFPESD